MELDKRIKEGKRPLTCFDTEQAKQFIGKECYFSDQICTFSKLLDAYSHVTANLLVSREKYLYVGELLTVSDSDGCCYEAGINGEAEWFQFCIPCEWVKEEKEKKYRPFSLDEFLKIFNTGDLVEFRYKDSDEVKCAMFTGYITDVDRIDDKTPGSCEIMLGIFHYSLLDLFKDFERFYNGEWQPFGVEV